MHRHHHGQHLARAQVGPHHAGHGRVPGVEQQGGRHPLQERSGQVQHLLRRVQGPHQRVGTEHRGQRAGAADPAAGTQNGAGHRVGLAAPAAAERLCHDHRHPGADDAQRDEQHRGHLVREGERRRGVVGPGRGHRRADQADRHAQAELQEQRHRHRGQARRHRRFRAG
jgi:hypothetical protein